MANKAAGIITLNPFSKTSSTGQYTRISLEPDIHTPAQQALAQPPIYIPLTGQLIEGRYLSYPIMVKIEEDEGEFIVSELKYCIHGEGATVAEAIETFKRIFSGHLDVLSEEEDNLSSYMYEQLEYLRSAIKME